MPPASITPPRHLDVDLVHLHGEPHVDRALERDLAAVDASRRNRDLISHPG
jgi:hypothetical protein